MIRFVKSLSAFLYSLTISNNSGSSDFDMVYDNGRGSSDCSVWNKLKQRLKEKGNQTVTNCHQLKMKAQDRKMRLTDVANTEQLLQRI